MHIATVNVNGIRAAARKGMGEWLAARRPEVLLLFRGKVGASLRDLSVRGADDVSLFIYG